MEHPYQTYLTPSPASCICRFAPDPPVNSSHAAGCPIVTVDNAPATSSASGSGSRHGEDLVSPTWELGIPPCADWVHCESVQDVDAEAGRGSGSGGAFKLGLRRKHWTSFVAGNLNSVAVIVLLIARLNDVCYDESIWSDDDVQGSLDGEDPSESSASSIKDTVLFTLAFGFMVDIFFAVVLSSIYQSPLDLKSVHKLPPEDLLSCGEYFMVLVLAPFSWALLYLFGGTASRYLSLESSCGGYMESGLERYLAISGVSMTIIGLLFLGISVVGLIFSVGSPSRCTEGCCAVVRTIIRQHVLSKGPLIGLFWQLQGVVWAYRTGGLGLTVSMLVEAWAVAGVMLTAIGSLAPEKHDIVAGDLFI